MAYGICRIQKIKSWGELAGSGHHTTRERKTLNADPELNNIRVIGGFNDPDLATMVRDKIGDQTIRKNAVLAVEILLSASPEYFRPDDPSSAGVYEQEQLDAWTEKSVDWLKEQYQDRVVRAELHLDESTPHIHAYLVPLDDKEKLNCRALFGGSRHTLSKLQDSYAEAVEPLGLERGIKGSQATYTAVKQYYSDVNRDSLNLDLEEQLPQPLKDEPATNYRERVIENLQPSLDTINHQLSDYSLALKQKDEMERTARKLEQRVEELEFELREQASQPRLDDAIAQSANRPPVITSQNLENSTSTGSTDGSDDDDNNETIGAIAASNQKVELPKQLPSLPELELEAANSDNEAASSETEKDDEKLNYADIFAVSDDFDREFIQNRVREAREKAQAERAAEQARRTAETIEYRRAQEQWSKDVYKENINDPIFNQLISDEARALFEESIAQENMGAIAPDQSKLNDATAPEYASSLNSQTVPTTQHDPTAPTVPTEPNLDDDDQTDDDESVDKDINPVEENWLPLRSRLIKEYCLPAEILDLLHEDEWLYANDKGMAVFSVRTFQNIETGLCLFDLETGSSDWLNLTLDPDVEEEVSEESSCFWISPPNDKAINYAIITSDPIETISSIALDPSFGQNNTLYLCAASVEQLPIRLLNNPENIDVVVSLKGDEDGLELANWVLKAIPKSQNKELDEAGWNGILRDQEQEKEQEQERASEVEQIQLVPQYQSQQQSQMEL